MQTSTRARADAGVAQLTEEFAHLGEAPVLQLPRQARHGGMPRGEALRMAYDGSTASWWVRSTALTLLPRQLPLVSPLPSRTAPPPIGPLLAVIRAGRRRSVAITSAC